jgi:putative PEP-CTERM system histidine kinase
VVIVGIYFLIVGVLAQVVAMMGGIASFPAQALVVLVGLVGSAVMLLSDRFRASLKRFVSRHFHRAEHDFRKIWTEFTRRTSSVLDEAALGKHASEVIAENFDVLGVTIFRVDEGSPGLNFLCSIDKREDMDPFSLGDGGLSEISSVGRPFNLERRGESWAENLRQACPTKFEHGGDRLVIPLVASEHLAGLVVLSDRVNGVPYSQEEIDLLACIGDQLAGAFVNCSLNEKVLQAKELDAFQTVSTFFVHDLKNAANSLGLTLQNLPVHFDDPEFRADAVKSVGRTVERINGMILKLGSLRHDLRLRCVPCRLDLLCAEVIDSMDPEMRDGCVIHRELEVVPDHELDQEAMRSVITNLLVNACEAMPDGGAVTVAVRPDGGRLEMSVTDEGSGMSPDFIKAGLFRPFHSTKTKGLGIGMFQCKKIIEAHGGTIAVTSSPGEGSRFTLVLPAATRSDREEIST